MMRRIVSTRTLQLTILALLAVSAAQVFWWIADQSRRTEALQRRLVELYSADARAAAELQRLGADGGTIEALFPHLTVEPGAGIAILPEALEGLRRDRVRWLNQYGWEGAFFLVVLVVSMVAVWGALHQQELLRRRQQSFIAAVSHELKIPVASLQLAVETLGLRDLPRDRVIELADRMASDLSRMEDMVAKILDTSRLDERKVTLRPEIVGLSSAVRSVVEEVGTRATHAGIGIEVDIPDDVKVRADPAAVRTVLRNLLDNALQAVAGGAGRRVRITSRGSGRLVRVRIEDDGVGFAPEEATRLFQKFYRPGDEMRRRGSGQGLGLFIVRRLVELEGGRVEAASDGPGRGAAFEVSWPIAGRRHA